MAISRFWFCRLFATWVIVFGIASSADSVGWSDDFNDGSATDGNPVTWIENLGGAGPFNGIYDASSGDYLLDPADDNELGQSVSFVNVNFTDTYSRTQGIVLPGGEGETNGNLVLLGRLDPTTVSTYVLYFDVSGNLGLQLLLGGGEIFDESVDILDFNASMESVIELNIVGNELRGFTWQAGQQKPAEPQIVIVDDSSALANGAAGIAFAEDNEHNTSAIYRYATAQDTPFVDVSPGDYNVDGKVDAADYVMWREGINADPGQAGYDLWRQNFGDGAPGAGSVVTTAVPEPAGFILMLGVILASLVVGRLRLG